MLKKGVKDYKMDYKTIVLINKINENLQDISKDNIII